MAGSTYELSGEIAESLMSRATECYEVGLPIKEKISLARELYTNWKDALIQDETIASLLEEIKTNIETTWKVMWDLGVVEMCKHCDEEEGGSCCGKGIEDKFDAYLLLMNILMGVNLPDERKRADSCYFLLDNGCMLKVRLVLCVDYLCSKIMSELSHEDLIKLQEVSGHELLKGFILYDAIKKFIKGSKKATKAD